MWNVVNTETGKSKKFSDYTEIIKQPDGSRFQNKQDAVNAVNTHFVGAAATCGAPAADLAAARRALAATRDRADRSLRLTAFTPLEVYRILTAGVANKNTKDAYDVSISILRDAAAPLAYILSCFYNECRKRGSYPSILKHVKVSPLYKGKGKQDDINSYRPVSIIPSIAKIFEHGLSTRLVSYMAECACLSDRQYAYRAGRSTTGLTCELIRRILEARENHQQVAVIFCDLSKAFDVANHDLLAIKMQHYGIDGLALKLLIEFMTDRNQIVVGSGGSARSTPLTTSIGVAQGSSLSNIMFSLLLNDLPESINEGHILMYADDVAAVVTAPTVQRLEEKLNNVAVALYQWFKSNGLILNTTKTHFIHFNLAGRKYNPMSIKIGDHIINQEKQQSFLGFQLDSGLTWEHHIDKMCEKLGRACFALWRVSAILPQHMVRCCYFASIHSLLQYGVELWGRAADWERVFRMQKRAVRSIVRVSRQTSARPYFESLGILTVPALVILQAAMHARNNLASYSRIGDGHGYSMRHAHKLRAVPRRMTKSSKLVHVMAPQIYNSLPDEIRNASSTQSFKHKTKKWLVEKTIYKVNDVTN